MHLSPDFVRFSNQPAQVINIAYHFQSMMQNNLIGDFCELDIKTRGALIIHQTKSPVAIIEVVHP